MTFNATKTPYCQSCIKVQDTHKKLKQVDLDGKIYWMCRRCRDPLEKEAYRVDARHQSKAWGNMNRRVSGRKI